MHPDTLTDQHDASWMHSWSDHYTRHGVTSRGRASLGRSWRGAAWLCFSTKEFFQEFKLAIQAAAGHETGFVTKTTVLGVFDFRAFLNLAMLMRESERAGLLRKAVAPLWNRRTEMAGIGNGGTEPLGMDSSAASMTQAAGFFR